MALQPITHTPPSPAPDASVPQADMSTPAGMPNVDGKSPDELKSMLDQMGQGGQGVQPTPDLEQQANQKETAKEALKEAPKDVQIPDKFKNPDGSINTENLLKSYTEAEKNLGQFFQTRSEADRLKQENEQLMQLGEDLQRELQEAQKAPKSMSQPGEQMTAEEIEEYNTNPKAYMAKLMKQELSQMNQKLDNQKVEGHRDRMLDFKVNNALNTVKQKEGYKELAEDINNILRAGFVDYDPRGPELAYHAAVGMKMPQIVTEAKNQAFTEGYEKAKEEIRRQVTGGGSSTLPAGGAQLDDETLNKMSPEEIVRSGLLSVHPSK